MLRALLFQVLEQEPDLIPTVLPNIWAKIYLKFLRHAPSIWSESWTLRPLLAAFKRLLAQKEINIKLCFLIDGLDEFDGNHEVLAELFHDVVGSCSSASNVKVCVSSRPWVVFQDSFGMCPTLKLQNLTFDDIKRYVDQEFRKNSAFRNLLRQDPGATDALVEEVVTKAEGVFLWVHIVVKGLLKGIRNRDSISDLWNRVEAMPRELEPLYGHMMSQIEPGYLVWASKAFQIAGAVRELGTLPMPKFLSKKQADLLRSDHIHARNNSSQGGCLTILEFRFALDESLDYQAIKSMSSEEITFKCKETEFHITARCACLLEVTATKDRDDTSPESLVQYLHRTARDYLEEPRRWDTLLFHTQNITFKPLYSTMRSYGLVLQVLCNQTQPNAADKIRVRRMGSKILVSATYADEIGEFHPTQMEILDITDRLMTQHLGAGWYMRLNIHAVPRSLASSFFELCLFINLAAYVQEKLRQNPPTGAVAPTEMLYRRVTADSVRDSGSILDLTLEMASVLVAHGADPNWKYEMTLYGKSTWEEFLSQGLVVLNSRVRLNAHYIPIMSLFLSSGADPRASVFTNDERISVGECITRHIRPYHPVEMIGLWSDFKRALEMERIGQDI